MKTINPVCVLFLAIVLVAHIALSATRAVAPKQSGERVTSMTKTPTFTPSSNGLSKTSFKAGNGSWTISALPKPALSLPPLPSLPIGYRTAAVTTVPTNEWFKLRIAKTAGTNQFTVNFWKNAASRVTFYASPTPKWDTNTQVLVAIIMPWPSEPGWPSEMLIRLGVSPFVYATVGTAYFRLHIE